MCRGSPAVTRVPGAVDLTFSEAPDPAASTVEVLDGSGAPVSRGRARAGPDSPAATIPPIVAPPRESKRSMSTLPSGQVAVVWFRGKQNPVPWSSIAVKREPTCWTLAVTKARDPWPIGHPYVAAALSWICGTAGSRLPFFRGRPFFPVRAGGSS